LFYKPRTESQELAILKSLNNRMNSPEVNQTFYTKNKGFEGELLFDTWLEKLECPCLVLNDFLFQVNGQFFQIDSLVIVNNRIYVFEVKNFEWDAYYNDKNFYYKDNPKKEMSNPLLQLERAQSLLRQLLHKIDYSIPLYPSVVFINPEFMLYQAPLDQPLIFANQLNRFVKNLNSNHSPLGQKHLQLAAKLVSLIETENPYERLPDFRYEELRKGICCAGCCSFAVEVKDSNCICTNCNHIEKVEAAVLRSVKEFKLLFPNEKITTRNIYDWCQIIEPSRKIQRILTKNYTKVGVKKWMYYE